VKVGDSVEIEFLASTTDINGTYTVSAITTDTDFEIVSADPER